LGVSGSSGAVPLLVGSQPRWPQEYIKWYFSVLNWWIFTARQHSLLCRALY